MKYEINITSNKWQRKGDYLFFRGHFFDPNTNELINDVEQVEKQLDYLFNLSNEAGDEDARYNFCANRPDGQYTILYHHPNGNAEVYTDASKVYALWYREYEDKTIITDDFYSLIENATPDRTQIKIFRQSGALLGNDTLYKEIKRVSGHTFFLTKLDKEFTHNKNKSKRIYTQHPYYSTTTNKQNEETIKEEYRKKIDDAFDRMFRSLKPNQQIVIPLSGGYDSRLIACMIKRRGWENVLAYTMGKDVEGEQNIAREVAKKFGFKFIQIDFEKVIPNNEAESIPSELDKCIDFVGMGQNFEWIADYYAVRYLRSMKLLEEDAIFMPGFCGDTIGGSTTRKTMARETTSTMGIANRMLAVRFERGNPCNLFLQKKIAQYISEYSSYMQFQLEAMQPNKIVNACRVFFYFDYDVALPLYDMKLLEWCYTMPYEYLNKKILYNEVLEKYYFSPINVCYKKSETKWSAYFKQYIKSYIKAITPRSLHVKKRHFIDIVQEGYLTAGLRRYLVEKGEMKDMNDFISPNEVMTKYLLTRMKNI